MSRHIFKEEIKDTKGVIRIRKSKKNRQNNGQKKNDKRTNNDLQVIHIKLKIRVTRTPLKPGVNSCDQESLRFDKSDYRLYYLNIVALACLEW